MNDFTPGLEAQRKSLEAYLERRELVDDPLEPNKMYQVFPDGLKQVVRWSNQIIRADDPRANQIEGQMSFDEVH